MHDIYDDEHRQMLKSLVPLKAREHEKYNAFIKTHQDHSMPTSQIPFLYKSPTS